MHKTNTHAELPATALLGLAFAGFIAHAQLPIVSVDMIPGNGANNIDATVNAIAGQPLTVNIVLWPGAGGVTAYGVSAQFDNPELTYVNDTEPLPAGFAGHITAGSAGWTANVALNTDQVSNFEAQTAFGVAGPVNGPWLVIGTVSFTVGTPLNDGIADITPGFFHFSDAMLDNTYASLNPVFNSGFVIPEPGVISGATLLLGFAGVYGCRRRR